MVAANIWLIKVLALIYQLSYGICTAVSSEEDLRLNLVTVDETYSITPFSQTSVLQQQSCLGHCIYNTKCMSCEVHVNGNKIIECSLFNITFGWYKNNQTKYLVAKKHTKVFSKHFFKKSCTAWYKDGARTNGVYEIMILGRYKKRVYCNMESEGGGWLVFQHRFDGSVSFEDKKWEEYKIGFGKAEGEFWLGNKWLHLVTSSESHDLYVEAASFGGEMQTKRFGGFTIGNESSKYVFDYATVFSGYSTDKLFTKPKNSMFSTSDQDNDIFHSHCALKYKGGWWYSNCHDDLMNGQYSNDVAKKAQGIFWKSWLGHFKSLKKTMLMIRPSSF